MLISYANLKGHRNSAPECEDFKVNLNRAAVGEVSFTPTGRDAVLLCSEKEEVLGELTPSDCALTGEEDAGRSEKKN